MAAPGETILSRDTEQMPHPGTTAHLEYLHSLEIDPEGPLADPRIFLTETMAATSIARVLKKHHIPRAFQFQNQAIIDTRQINLKGGPLPDFRGYIDLAPPQLKNGRRADRVESSPNPRNLIVSARPNRTYSIDAVIPITRANLFDQSRPVQASYIFEKYRTRSNKTLTNKRYIYDEVAQPTDQGIDPDECHYEYQSWVLSSVIQEMAGILLEISQRMRKESQEQTNYPGVEFPIWPDGYLDDDPNEFVDDPDEFLKKPREQW